MMIPTVTLTLLSLLLLLLSLSISSQQQQRAFSLSLLGQQFFGNGTGIAYFDDGITTPRFTHTITPDRGYYYDNSTVFYVGEIPGVSSENGVNCGGNSTVGSSGNIIDITIINGISLLENKTQGLDPTPIVKIKPGDTVIWVNQDIAYHRLFSPPPEPGSEVNLFTVSTTLSSNGGAVSCTFTEPGGFHYGVEMGYPDMIPGVVIVEGESHSNTSPLTQQMQQQPSGAPSSQQPQSQQSQNQVASASIGQGSSSLTTDAYQPNPVQVSVGGTVTWTNEDSLSHTVTSGENATPDQQFESGIMAPRATFEHTFTEAGEYPYFCLLHPNMVGTVSVSS